MTPKPSLAQQLDALSQETVLQCLASIHKRRAHLDQLERLLQARLAQLTSTPDANRDHGDDTLLTSAEVATALKVSKARAYELIRTKVLPSIRIGVRQVRVRRSDLAQYLQPRTR